MKILIVAPFYAGGIRGGAEDVICNFAWELAAEPDVEIEVWSTRTTSFDTWNNDIPADWTDPRGLNVKLYDTNVHSKKIWDKLHAKVNAGTAGYLSARLWAKTGIYGKGMEGELRNRLAEFTAVYLPHYFYGSTHRLAPIAGQKAVLHPFFHDETAAQNLSIVDLFNTVQTVLVNTIIEKEYAESRAKALGNSFIEVGNIV